jgi:hypothetical protein
VPPPDRARSLVGAYGVVRPPTPAMLQHPERVRRFHTFQTAMWVVRLGTIAGVLALLLSTHVISL